MGAKSSLPITDKERIEADVVILSIGIRPNSKLAREAGLEIGPFGDIAVDEYMQTSDPDIYAGGDCVANVNLVTGQKAFVPTGFHGQQAWSRHSLPYNRR